MRQGGLAHAGQVFQKQVPASEHTCERESHRVTLAEHDAIDLLDGGVEGGTFVALGSCRRKIHVGRELRVCTDEIRPSVAAR